MADPVFHIVPIQIREDVRVDLRLPVDLTTAEANKIAAVVKALAFDPTTPIKAETHD